MVAVKSSTPEAINGTHSPVKMRSSNILGREKRGHEKGEGWPLQKEPRVPPVCFLDIRTRAQGWPPMWARVGELRIATETNLWTGP